MFSLIAKIGGDVTGFKLAIDRVNSMAGGMGAKLARRVSSLFAIGSVVAFGKSVLEAADRIGDMAEQTAITTDEVQKLISVFSKYGIEFSTIQTAMEKFAEARRDAMAGDVSKQKIFEQLGISQDVLKGLDERLKLMEAIGRAMKDFSGEDQGAILSNLAGIRSGPKLRAGMTEFGATGGATGESFISPGAVEQWSKDKDWLSRTWREVKSFVADFRMIGKVVPEIFGGGEPGKLIPPGEGIKPPLKAFVQPSKVDRDAELKATKERMEIEQKISEILFARLSNDEKRRHLQTMIVSLKAQEQSLSMLGFMDASRESQLLRMQQEDLLAGIKPVRQQSPDVTALQRIGAYVPGGQSIGSQQLSQLKIIAKETAKVPPLLKSQPGEVFP